MSKKSALSDPVQLSPLDKKENLLQVIIETPRGSRNEYSFDTEQKIFSLKKQTQTSVASRERLSVRRNLGAR